MLKAVERLSLIGRPSTLITFGPLSGLDVLQPLVHLNAAARHSGAEKRNPLVPPRWLLK